MTVLEKLNLAIIDGDVQAAIQLTEEAVDQDCRPGEIFSQALSPAMEEVGRRMQRGEYYIPEVLISAKAMKKAAEVLKPLILESGEIQGRGTVVMGTVKGDLHDIGKNLVIMMLEGAGFRVVDLGTDVSTERFAAAVEEHRPQVLGMSALLTTTMMQMPTVLGALEARGLRSTVKVMVGGAPLSQRFVEEIGADGFGTDGAAAVDLTKLWVPEPAYRAAV